MRKSLTDLVAETYGQLRENNLVSSQYDFSRNWLKRSAGYYGYLKSTGAETTADVALALLVECRNRTERWEIAARRPKTSQAAKDLFQRLALVSDDLQKHVQKEVFERYGVRR